MRALNSFLFVSTCLAAGTAAADQLSLDVASASVRIAPGISERRAVRLPGLELDVEVNAACTGDARPEAITLSSADTRLRLAGNTLAAAEAEGTRFAIPARQLPPLSSRGFCVTDLGADQPLTLMKTGFVSIYATLSCRTADAVTMTTTSAGIDVLIECDRELLDAAQEPSTDKTSDRNSSVRPQD